MRDYNIIRLVSFNEGMLMSMKNKITISVVSILLFLVAGLIIYPIACRGTIRSYTCDYIEALGYSVDNIKNIEIQHSYISKLLGYNEWRIPVEFEKKQNMFFWFSYREGKIFYEGVSSEPMMDKEDVIKYSDMFKNGLLLD